MSEKIACLFLNISNHEGDNFKKDDFFAPNSVNSFKQWHPEIEVHYVTNDNINDYIGFSRGVYRLIDGFLKIDKF